jgi:hypothetical protein
MAASTRKAELHGTVRVTLPASVAYSPDLLKKSIQKLMGRLGCLTCFSGANCLFQVERDFVVDAKAGALERVALNPQPLPPGERSIAHVALASGARFDINKVFKAVDSVINTLGSCPCHSGFDVLYQNEIRMIGINEKLEAQQFGG